MGTAPIDYEFEGRMKKAGDLVKVLLTVGWEPSVTINDDMWIKAVQATGRKKPGKDGKWLSEETKTLTLRLLQEHWAGRNER